MEELDEKKRAALEQTWLKVNEDFGSIFGTLLPGTTAKLEPQEGKSFLEGRWYRLVQPAQLNVQNQSYFLRIPHLFDYHLALRILQVWKFVLLLEVYGRSLLASLAGDRNHC